MDQEQLFEKIYFEHFDAVYLYVRRRVPSKSLAEDVVSDTFVTAWEKLGDLESADSALYWLYRIAFNHLRWSFRQSSSYSRLIEKVKSSYLNVLSHSPEDLVVGYEASVQSLLALSEADRELIQLIVWECLTVPELAEVLNCSENAVYVRVHRARARLQEKGV